MLPSSHPKTPSARCGSRSIGNSYKKRGFPRQARDDRAFCEKPNSIIVREGFERSVRFPKANHLAFVRGTKLIVDEP
jgi:hypothetical protein